VRSLNGPTERVACYCCGLPRLPELPMCRKNSGTCIGRRCHGWALGKENQSFPLAANMQYPSSRREYANVGGMVS